MTTEPTEGVILGGPEAANGAGGGNAAMGAHIKDSDTAHFMDDVINASQQVPVIVDFWAPWCGPCKQLGPALEKVVAAAGGKVKLVKINIDENQELAQQLRVQSIPMVYAFQGGQPVDGFVGALPESQVRAFVEKLAGGDVGPTQTEQLEAAGQQALEAGTYDQALEIYQHLVQAEPESAAAFGGMAQALIGLGHLDEAQELLDGLAPKLQDRQDIASARAALSLARNRKPVDEGAAAALQAKLDANPNDHQARFDLAEQLVSQGRNAEAVEALLYIVGKDRKWNEDGARKKLLELFDAFGPTDPVTLDGRRALSSILFS